MCGIFGVSRMTETTYRMLPYLAWEMEDRGHDSWGATNGVDIIKHLGPITNSWQEALPEFDGWPWGIFHTRAASTGAVSITNQHPFTAKHDKLTVIGIHNGIVTNHDMLNMKYDRKFECDSPHIFHAIAGESPTEEIIGYGNLAWFESTEEQPVPVLHLLHFNSGNLEIARLKSGEIVFASTRDPIDKAIRMAGGQLDRFYRTDGDKRYFVGASKEFDEKDELYEAKAMKFGGRTGSYSGDTVQDLIKGRSYGRPTFTQSSFRDSRKPNIALVGATDRENNICLRNGCTNKVVRTRKTELVCLSCMTTIIDAMNFEIPTESLLVTP